MRSWTVLAIFTIGAARGQFGRGGDWTTSGNDAQRSSWVRTDAKISRESLQKPGFQFLWKFQLRNDSLTQPVLTDRYIGYRGFRSLAFVGGSSGRAFAVDTDLNRLEWEMRFDAGSRPAGRSADCPGGLTSALTSPTVASMSPAPTRLGGFGRGGPARSGVGEPGDGAVTLAQALARREPPSPAGPPGGPRANRPGRPGGFGAPAVVFALSGDGMLRLLNVAHGQDVQPPMKFLPPGADAHGLIVVDDVAYVATTRGCGGAPDGVWALDLETKQVATWKSNSGVAGSVGPALGPDGTLLAATTAGQLVALEPKTLRLKDSYQARQGFTSSPVIFEHKGRILLAAGAKDDRVYLFDTVKLSKPLSAVGMPSPASESPDGALASWTDSGGATWVVAPAATGIVALRVVDREGAPVLESGWVSRPIPSPLPPMAINGVVFAASGGSSPAVLYALNGSTGNELWNSGSTIASFARGGLAGGGGQVYLGTDDGSLYAFGFPMEH
jgi:outer membrane protein assembly factor BamB